MTISIGAPIRPDNGRAASTLRWAEIAGKKIFILSQKGAYADLCYDHGCLLAEPLQDGVFPEILDTIHTSTDFESGMLSWITNAIYRRLSDDVFRAQPNEFQDGAEALTEAIMDTLDDPRFSDLDVRDAVVAIDVGNCAEGLARRLEKPLAEEAAETLAYVIGAARRYRRQSSGFGIRRAIMENRDGVGRAVRRFGDPRNRVGFGCTAFGAGPAMTADGRGLHARNFDAAFFAWNKCPGLFIIDERDTNPNWHRYVAVGTAGLTYSGGISGLNEAGIAASIHQMSTARYDPGRARRGYAIAPFLQQRILREAGSLDEAEAILRDAHHHGAWTIVVSDARAGTAARFEMCGAQVVVRTDLGGRFVQSNHYLDDSTAERHDHFGDLHYTPTFGKWLETRARLETASDALAAAGDQVSTDWAIGLLAGHADAGIGGATRTFGRTICRAYGLMSSIARADPDRTRRNDEIWFSIGNAQPGPHADFAGFAIDWDALTLTPVADRPTRRPALPSPEFAAAASEYVAAFSLYTRPVMAGGGYLGRDPTPGEDSILRQMALQHLDKACMAVEDAGETDFALRYMRARMRHAEGDLDGAEDDWSFLRALAETPGFKVHDYERALVLILSAATAYGRRKDADAKGFLDRGEAKLAEVRNAHFHAEPVHPDLDGWSDVIADLRKRGDDADLPKCDFVTVE